MELGSVLRQAREARGLSQAILAEQNFLSTERIEALESGDHTRLPEPIYLMAQARRVATSLGLDGNALIDPLLDLQLPREGPAPPATTLDGAEPNPAAGQTLGSEPRPPAGTNQPSGAKTPWGAVAGGLAVLLLLAGGAALLWGRRGLQPVSPVPIAIAEHNQEAPAQKPGTDADRVEPKATNGPAADLGSTLELSSEQPSWVEVRDGAGRSLYRGQLKGTARFALGSGLEVLAGRPDLVQVRAGEGAATPLGPIDQIRWQAFDRMGQRQPQEP